MCDAKTPRLAVGTQVRILGRENYSRHVRDKVVKITYVTPAELRLYRPHHGYYNVTGYGMNSAWFCDVETLTRSTHDVW